MAGVCQSERRANPTEKTSRRPAKCRLAHFGGKLSAKTNNRKSAANDALGASATMSTGALSLESCTFNTSFFRNRRDSGFDPLIHQAVACGYTPVLKISAKS
ncbi:MAG: hypothetical protein Q7U80_05280 [Thiobacillus sp.]|nr:hypothetical protein [Thiobacillus sp.]